MKRALVLLLFLVLFIGSSAVASASLVTVTPSGEVETNVLSSETGFVSVKNSAVGVGDGEIALYKAEDGLAVEVGDGQQKLDVTDYSGTVVELEERPSVKNVFIEVQDGNFAIREGEVVATTEYPISIDTKQGVITLKTDSGDRIVAVMPAEAVESLVKAKTITRQKEGQAAVLSESELGELMYQIAGEKVIDIFGFYEYPVEVSVDVSATTGETLSVHEPAWLRVVRVILQ